jgi:hypothetical protein
MDAATLRLVDVTKYINSSGFIYMKFLDTGQKAAYGGSYGFLRRLNVMGIYKSSQVYVKLIPDPYPAGGTAGGFTLNKVTFRKFNQGSAIATAPFSFADLAIMAQQWLDQITFSESGGKVVFEAEDYSIAAGGQGAASGTKWSYQTDERSSGRGYVAALPDNGLVIDTGIEQNAPHIGYEVNFSTAGTYYVWLKCRANNIDANGLHYGIDGTAVSDSSNSITLPVQADFGWRSQCVNGARPAINVSTAGVHTVDFWMQTDGAQIDRVLLTTDSDYNPQTNEPQESSCNRADMTTDYNSDGIINLLDFALFSDDWIEAAF